MARSFSAALACAAFAAAHISLVAPASAQDEAFVAVTAIVEHPALDAARDGVRDELAANGYEAGRNLRGLDLNLAVPSPTPIPLPDDYTTGELGALLYLNFTHDNMTFRVQWESTNNADKKVSAKYFPRNQPSQLQILELPWREEWSENTPALIQAVLQAYEAQKSGSGR